MLPLTLTLFFRRRKMRAFQASPRYHCMLFFTDCEFELLYYCGKL